MATSALLSRSAVSSVEEASKVAELTAEEEAWLSGDGLTVPISASLFFIARARTQFILKRPQLALQSLQRVNLAAMAGFSDNASEQLLQALCHLALIRQAARGGTVTPTPAPPAASPAASVPYDVTGSWAVVNAAQTQIGVWAAVCPANFAPMEAVVQAEVAFTRWVQHWEVNPTTASAQMDDDILRIRQLYQRARELISHDTGRRPPRLGKGCVDESSASTASSARSSPRSSNSPSPLRVNPWLCAIAAERMADFLYTAGCDGEHQRVLSECVSLYLDYGAYVKVQQMHLEWRDVLRGHERLWSFLHAQEEARKAKPKTFPVPLLGVLDMAETPTEAGHSSMTFPFSSSGAASASSSCSSASSASSNSPHSLTTTGGSSSSVLPTSAPVVSSSLPSPPPDGSGLSYLENDLLGDSQFDPTDGSRSSFQYFSLPSSSSPSSASASTPSTRFTDFGQRSTTVRGPDTLPLTQPHQHRPLIALPLCCACRPPHRHQGHADAQ